MHSHECYKLARNRASHILQLTDDAIMFTVLLLFLECNKRILNLLLYHAYYMPAGQLRKSIKHENTCITYVRCYIAAAAAHTHIKIATSITTKK